MILWHPSTWPRILKAWDYWPQHLLETKNREKINPIITELHWFPIRARTEFKILTLTYKTLKYNETKYLRNILQITDSGASLNTIYTNEINRLFQPYTNSKYGERAFKIRTSPNTEQLKKKLKTHLFKDSYDLNDKTMNESYKL